MIKNKEAQCKVTINGSDWKRDFGCEEVFTIFMPFDLCKKCKDLYESYGDNFTREMKKDKEIKEYLEEECYYESFYDFLIDLKFDESKFTYTENGETIQREKYIDASYSGFYHWEESIYINSIKTNESLEIATMLD